MLKYGLGEWVCERVCGVGGIVRTVAKELVEGRMRVFGESEGIYCCKSFSFALVWGLVMSPNRDLIVGPPVICPVVGIILLMGVLNGRFNIIIIWSLLNESRFSV